MQILQPFQAKLPQNSQIIAVGGDIGAGLEKLVFGSGDFQFRFRGQSKIYETKGDELDETFKSRTHGGRFFYHQGSRKELERKEFVTGTLAQLKAPTTHIKLSDDPALKAEYALHLIFGALATQAYRPTWNLHLVLSIHSPKIFKDLLIEKTAGVHTVSFDGSDKPTSQVHLNIAKVLPEGAGSYAFCIAQDPPLIDRTGIAISVDLGTSTIITTVFAPGEGIIHRKVLDTSGCIDLLDKIAEDKELTEELKTGKVGNIETIRSGIESGKFQYGTRNFHFKSIYDRLMKSWLDDRLRLTFKEVEEWRDSALSFVAWGGGVEMPQVAEILTEHGITPVPNGGWANALGLQRMAEGILARSGK
jgi:hypothetical protein